MATSWVNRVQPPQNPVAPSQGAVTKQLASVFSQQFIPPGIYTSLLIDDVVSTYY